VTEKELFGLCVAHKSEQELREVGEAHGLRQPGAPCCEWR
jgi:hypothetical protein